MKEEKVFLRAPILFLEEQTMTPITKLPDKGNGALTSASIQRLASNSEVLAGREPHTSLQCQFSDKIFIKTKKVIISQQLHNTDISDL